jgi:holo-[acyl-carrier protein] synthase
VIEGLGIEIVEVARFKRAMNRWGASFLRRLFTEGELQYCLARRYPEIHLSARFAAKIGFLKAFGGFMPCRDNEVVRDKKGRPSIRVCSCGLKALKVSLTISHTAETSMALVLLESE